MCPIDPENFGVFNQCGNPECEIQQMYYVADFNNANTSLTTGVHPGEMYANDMTNSFDHAAQTSGATYDAFPGYQYVGEPSSDPYRYHDTQSYPLVEGYANTWQQGLLTPPSSSSERQDQQNAAGFAWPAIQPSPVIEQLQPNSTQPASVDPTELSQRPPLAPPRRERVPDAEKFVQVPEMRAPDDKVTSINGLHFCAEDFCQGSTTYSSRQTAKEHWLSAHANVVWQCLKCPRTFETSSGARRHYAGDHQERKYPCPWCGKIQTSRSNLTRHTQKCRVKCRAAR